MWDILYNFLYAYILEVDFISDKLNYRDITQLSHFDMIIVI